MITPAAIIFDSLKIIERDDASASYIFDVYTLIAMLIRHIAIIISPASLRQPPDAAFMLSQADFAFRLSKLRAVLPSFSLFHAIFSPPDISRATIFFAFSPFIIFFRQALPADTDFRHFDIAAAISRRYCHVRHFIITRRSTLRGILQMRAFLRCSALSAAPA